MTTGEGKGRAVTGGGTTAPGPLRPASAGRATLADRATLTGPRTVLERGRSGYPEAFERVAHPPERLYVVGDPEALSEGIAVVGARKATPYGRGCASRFARMAAERGVTVISGGARGCDAAAHKAAVEAGGRTVVFLGGGCDRLYPAEHAGLFQRIVDAGGAVASEHAWGESPLPYRFRERNRLIAGLARATLIVEAGVPSGTFSTADEALAAGREVLAVPGAITATASRGANRLIRQGAAPIVDDESFEDALNALFGDELRPPNAVAPPRVREAVRDAGAAIAAPPSSRASPALTERLASDEGFLVLADALRSETLGMDELHRLAVEAHGADGARAWLMERLVEGERAGFFARHPNGRWGPA